MRGIRCDKIVGVSGSRREFTMGMLAAAAAQAKTDTQLIDQTLKDGIKKRGIPCAVGAAATATETLYTGAFGTRDSSGTAVRPDTIFAIASMTKAVTSVGAMQLVEQGKVGLDEPIAKHLPQLARMEVLEGFDGAGKPILRPAKKAVTLRQLLTHTSGLCYGIWDEKMFRYDSGKAGPAPRVTPLMFEPGERWQYGTGVDWAGRLIEAVSGMTLEDYFQAKILKPLGMTDTTYVLPQGKFERLVGRYQREESGALKEMERKMPPAPKEYNGGGGLFSTAADYVRFMQMILGKGRGSNKAEILQAKTVETMAENQIGALTAGKMKSYRPLTSADVDIQPGHTEKWGLGFLINTTAYEKGRAAGSLAWAGIYNTFFWIDPKKGMCGTLLMQYLPFVDREAVGLLGDFERAVYGGM